MVHGAGFSDATRVTFEWRGALPGVGEALKGLVARSLSRLVSVVACSVEDALDAAQVQR